MTQTLPKLNPRLITTKEAAELLNVSPRTILNWIEKGSIPYVELPGAGDRRDYRIPQIALLRSLSGNYDLVAELEQLEDAAAGTGLTEEIVAEAVVGN